jgi:hypothetical protein
MMKFSAHIVEEAKKVKSMNISKVVDNDEWQVIRKSLVGNWKNNHKQNIATLRAYYKKHKDSPIAIRRILNVLVGSVHRAGHTKNQPETDALRKEIRIRWRNMNNEPYDAEDPKYKTGEI